MDRSKIVAIVTGVLSLLLAIGYLLLVQLLDFRGEMIPAPISLLPSPSVAVGNLAQSIAVDLFRGAPALTPSWLEDAA
ncbi:MAG: hypothetical protein ACHWZW_00870 [Spirulina sp.]